MPTMRMLGLVRADGQLRNTGEDAGARAPALPRLVEGAVTLRPGDARRCRRAAPDPLRTLGHIVVGAAGAG